MFLYSSIFTKLEFAWDTVYSNQVFHKSKCLFKSGISYHFFISDFGKDGLCCGGYYEIFLGGVLLKACSDFGYSDVVLVI